MSPCLTYQFDSRSGSPACSQNIVNDHCSVSLAQCISMQFQCTGSILQFIFAAVHGTRQFPGFAQGDEPATKFIGQCRTQWESASLNTHNKVR